MRPAPRGAPATRRLPAPLTASLLLLLLRLLWCPHAARGDCGLPPEVPNATANLQNRTTFPEGTLVGYFCDVGFIKKRGEANVVYCLQNGEWSTAEIYCLRTCGVTPRLSYGNKKDIYIPVSYYPAGFVVEYECNPGFATNHSVSGNLTCLQDYTWSKPEVFCYKKSCLDPGKIKNGHISIPTDILFASYIYFSCDPGYKLVGLNSTYCDYLEDDMIWAHPFPECKEIPTSTQKPITTDAPTTRVHLTPQNPSTVDVSVTQHQTVFTQQTTSKANGLHRAGMIAFLSGLSVGVLIIATMILTSIFGNYGRSGTYYLHENSKALNVLFHNLTETDDASAV